MTEMKTRKPSRDDVLLRAAAESVIGIRRAARKYGVASAREFVNTIIFAAMLIEQNYRGEDGKKASRQFRDVFEESAQDFREMIESGRFADAVREMQDETGFSGMPSETDRLIATGLKAEGILIGVGTDYGFSADEMLRFMALAVALPIVANADRAVSDIIVDTMIEGVREKIEVWKQIIPPSEDLEDDEDRFLEE